jgi:hypothetical protein
MGTGFARRSAKRFSLGVKPLPEITTCKNKELEPSSGSIRTKRALRKRNAEVISAGLLIKTAEIGRFAKNIIAFHSSRVLTDPER